MATMTITNELIIKIYIREKKEILSMGKYKGFSGAGMNTNKNVSSVVRRAQQMQEEMEKVQEEIEAKEVTATAGGGMVTVVAGGNKEIKEITIKPEVVDPDDIDTWQDLIIVAVNDAIKQAEDMMAEGMGAITGGLNIPGLF